jgi:hypothetical protein
MHAEAGAPSTRLNRQSCPLQELLHHCGARADFHRLASRLSRERLACAWPYTACRAQSEVGPDGSLTLMSATPATIACLALLLPELRATTVVLSGARPHGLEPK